MSSEKTEKPTPKKVKDARKKGQVAKSQELPVGLQLAAVLLYLHSQGKTIIADIVQLIALAISATSLPIDQAINEFVGAFFSVVIDTVGVLAAILCAVTVIGFVSQTGFMASPESLQFKLDKLNVANNLKQLFSLKNAVELLKALVKLIVVSLVFAYLLSHYAGSLQFLPYYRIKDGCNVVLQLIFWLWGALVFCYIVFFIADFAFQKHQLMKQLKMSKEDIKQEFKDSEGNQEIKGHRRAMHQEIQSGSLAANVKKSSVLVRNPTHVAICLYYQEGDTPLPKVVAKGVDKQALWMVKLAEKEQIPIIENIPLARTLLAEVDEDNYIPEHLFDAVSSILWLVKGLKEQSSAEGQY